VGVDDSVDFYALGPDLAGDSLTQRIVADAAQPFGVDTQAAQSDCHVALRTADTEDQVLPIATLALTGNLFEHFHITASCRSAAA